jgi:hypothetical protein
MKVTLRKANALQQNILEAIKNTPIVNNVTFNEFEDVSEKFIKVNNDLANSFNATKTLYESLYSIRKLVGKTNSEEINGLLCDVALLDKQIHLYNIVASSQPRTDSDVVRGKLEKIKNSTESSRLYGRSDEIVSTILDETDINKAKSKVNELKKEKQKIQDKVLELNIKTEIELPSDVAATLTNAGIL